MHKRSPKKRLERSIAKAQVRLQQHIEQRLLPPDATIKQLLDFENSNEGLAHLRTYLLSRLDDYRHNLRRRALKRLDYIDRRLNSN